MATKKTITDETPKKKTSRKKKVEEVVEEVSLGAESDLELSNGKEDDE